MSELRLTALDADDLEVVSTHMQDAIVLVGDISFSPAHQQFALLANRFDWQAAERSGGERRERRRSALVFDRVQRARFRRIRSDVADAVLSLLSIRHEPGESTGDEAIELTFSGGGAIRLDVECIEARLEDLGKPWPARHTPAHAD